MIRIPTKQSLKSNEKYGCSRMFFVENNDQSLRNTKKKISAPRMDLILSWPKPSRFFNASTQTLLGFVHRRWWWSITLGSYEIVTAGLGRGKSMRSTNRWLDFFRQMMSDRYNSVLGAIRNEGWMGLSHQLESQNSLQAIKYRNPSYHPDRIQVDITPQELLYHLIASKDDVLGYCS